MKILRIIYFYLCIIIPVKIKLKSLMRLTNSESKINCNDYYRRKSEYLWELKYGIHLTSTDYHLIQ